MSGCCLGEAGRYFAEGSSAAINPVETNWSLSPSAAVSFSGQKPEESSSVSLDHTYKINTVSRGLFRLDIDSRDEDHSC